MNVGYYFHVEAGTDADGSVRVPEFTGRFVTALAERAGSVTFFGHGASRAPGRSVTLDPSRVRFVDLGPLRSHPARLFHPRAAMELFGERLHGIEALVMHAPTPLLPHLIARMRDRPVCVLAWGDYGGWRPQRGFPWWRNLAIAAYVEAYNRRQRRATKDVIVVANDGSLVRTLGAPPAAVIPFAGLTDEQIARLPPVDEVRADASRPFRLIYAGRIVREKGIFEAVEAVAILVQRGYDVCIDLAGDETPSAPALDELRSFAESLGVAERLAHLGSLSSDELTAAYRAADAFVIPSYWDSFPRSLHEAMACGLPSVASRVGGVSHHLEDGVDALLIGHGSAPAVADAVARLIDDPSARRSIARRGAVWARSHTIESNVEVIVGAIERAAVIGTRPRPTG